jgi:UDP-N-acetylmuramate dehydrogenase
VSVQSNEVGDLQICRFAHLQTGASLEKYTSSRVGGPAEWLVVAESVEELVEAVRAAQADGLPWRVLGGASNVLVSDAGVRGLVIVNRARQIVFEDDYVVYAESGANLAALARGCVARGWAGLEWAVGVPGTVGGAVVGNAGAHGGDTSGVLQSATVLEAGEVVEWPVERLEYAYRNSVLKRDARRGVASRVVLTATLALEPGDPAHLAQQADEFLERRKRIQPPGHSFGSMFKNPPGDYAGRLIEAAGLKGMQVGGAQVSPLHANFFVNTGGATAADMLALVELARQGVREQFGVELELEVELVGEWESGE